MWNPTGTPAWQKPYPRIAAARPPKRAKTAWRIDYVIEGAPGLRLRVSGDRVKRWSLLYTPRNGGNKQRLALGNYPTVSLAEAKRVALQYQGGIAGGADPAGERQAERKATTFAELANIWLERHAKVKKRTWKNDAYMIEADLLPALGALKAHAVKISDILRIVDGVMDRGSPYQANRVLMLVKTIFHWGMKRGLVPVSPAALMDRQAS